MATKSYELSQAEAGYVPLSTTANQACANCRWFCAVGEDGGGDCRIVEDDPNGIMQTGWCNRWEAIPEMTSEPVEVVVVETEAPEMDMGEMSSTPKPGIIQRVKTWFAKTPGLSGVFHVFKAADGQPRWVAAFSNNFQDRDEEIISEKAWDGYLARIEQKLVPMPQLWLGHIPGTEHGQADMVFGVGNFVVASGTFTTNETAKAALKYYQTAEGKNVPLSHGFTFPKWAFKDGVYDVVNTFEISTLPPPMMASNPFTEYEVFDMKQISPEQKAALEKVLGAHAKTILDKYEQGSEEIKAAGVAYKAFTNADPEPAPETQTEPAPLAVLVGDLIEAQHMLTEMVRKSMESATAEKARAINLETRLHALEGNVQSLQAEQRLTPRAASGASETKLSEKDAEKAKADFPIEYDPAFPGMQVPLKR